MMIEEPRTASPDETTEDGHSLPFPYNQQSYCRYEPTEKQLDQVSVVVVERLVRDQDDLSDVARRVWGPAASLEIRSEHLVARIAMETIISNVERDVKYPSTTVSNFVSVALSAKLAKPGGIVISGTLRDV